MGEYYDASLGDILQHWHVHSDAVQKLPNTTLALLDSDDQIASVLLFPFVPDSCEKWLLCF